MKSTLVILVTVSSDRKSAVTAWRKLSPQCPASPALIVSWRSSHSRGGILGFLCLFKNETFRCQQQALAVKTKPDKSILQLSLADLQR